ncbi:hypothetical protein C487_04338 [Natrinema pallidum DSM 3751]|uniref:Uncharacterized protein n=1 Tax=Natrinema pallidum DSM 3751 TaxID=1227495 RepID=L9Z238_9EURY|nr:hypothetical protein C487_04338 [Natrinema pallidum DSM 3751]
MSAIPNAAFVFPVGFEVESASPLDTRSFLRQRVDYGHGNCHQFVHKFVDKYR